MRVSRVAVILLVLAGDAVFAQRLDPVQWSLSSAGDSLVWMKNQYDQALARSREEQKPVLVTFTGYACTNCHWMKVNMFAKPEIAASEKNQEMQASRFNTIAIPFYAIVDAAGNTVSTFPGLTRDTAEWQAFLEKGRRPELAEATGAASTE